MRVEIEKVKPNKFRSCFDSTTEFEIGQLSQPKPGPMAGQSDNDNALLKTKGNQNPKRI